MVLILPDVQQWKNQEYIIVKQYIFVKQFQKHVSKCFIMKHHLFLFPIGVQPLFCATCKYYAYLSSFKERLKTLNAPNSSVLLANTYTAVLYVLLLLDSLWGGFPVAAAAADKEQRQQEEFHMTGFPQFPSSSTPLMAVTL